jgi:hypothetical protein
MRAELAPRCNVVRWWLRADGFVEWSFPGGNILQRGDLRVCEEEMGLLPWQMGPVKEVQRGNSWSTENWYMGGGIAGLPTTIIMEGFAVMLDSM